MIAHLLTSFRLLLVVPVSLGLARPDVLPEGWLLVCITVGISTDYFDGIIARLTETASPKGRLFDHSTDFLFVTGGLGGAALAGDVSIAFPILIGCAFTQYVLDSFWMHREKELRMSTLGRWNGILYFVPLVLISVSRLDLMASSNHLWSTVILLVSYGLILSTIASIIDRAISPSQ